MEDQDAARERVAREVVSGVISQRYENRCTRRARYSKWLSKPRGFTVRMDQLRARMARAAARSSDKRSSAFVPLKQSELATIDQQMDEYRHLGQLRVLEDPYLDPCLVSDHRFGRSITRRIGLLRANYLTGSQVIDAQRFRKVTQELLRDVQGKVLEFAHRYSPIVSNERAVVTRTIIALPWRAALVVGESFRAFGIMSFFHFGARRNERTLATELYHAPNHDAMHDDDLASKEFIIADPMLATGGTAMTIVNWLWERSIHIDRITVFSLIAAPEGVDALCHTYPGLRIITCALDERLDKNGYIVPGLGDFGDLAMEGIDEAYAERRWVRTGFLTQEQAALVLERTRKVAAEQRAAAGAP